MQTKRTQSGATLIEAMVSALIIGIGIFGMVGLQIRTLKANNSAYQRTQAVILTYYIMDAMRVDAVASKATTYNTGTGDVNSEEAVDAICAEDDVTVTGLAGSNLKDWLGAIKEGLGDRDSSCGSVVCDSEGACRVQIRWDDSHAGGMGEQTVQVVSKL